MAVKNIIFKVSADTTELNQKLADAKKALEELNKAATASSKPRIKSDSGNAEKQAADLTKILKKEEDQQIKNFVDYIDKKQRKEESASKQAEQRLKSAADKAAKLKDAENKNNEKQIDRQIQQLIAAEDKAEKARDAQRRKRIAAEKKAAEETEAEKRRILQRNLDAVASLDKQRQAALNKIAEENRKEQARKQSAADSLNLQRMRALEAERKKQERIDSKPASVPEPPTSAWREFVQIVRNARTVLAAIYVGNEVINFGKNILNAAGNYEVLNIQFETFFKSAALAQNVLEDIQNLAVETPFKVSELQDSARILSAYGFAASELVPVLQRLGNIVSGTNIPIQQLSLVFGQVKAAGRLMGQDLLQLVNAGFNPLQIISQKTGESMLSLRKRMEQGKISFDEINAAFITATSSGGAFDRLSERLGLTFEGRVNALVERSEIFKRKLGENLLPTAKAVVEGLINLGSALKSIGGFVKENSGIFIALSGSLLSLLLNTRQYTLSLLKFSALRQIVNIKNAYANVLQKISIIQTNAEAAATGRAAGVKRIYATATGLATAAMKGLSAAFAANPIGFLITALTTAIGLWKTFNDEADKASNRTFTYFDPNKPRESEQRIADVTAKRLAQVDEELKAIQDVSKSFEERKKLAEQFNKQYGTNLQLEKDGVRLTKEKLKWEAEVAKSAADTKASKLGLRAGLEEELKSAKLQLSASKAIFDEEKQRIKDLGNLEDQNRQKILDKGLEDVDTYYDKQAKLQKEIEKNGIALSSTYTDLAGKTFSIPTGKVPQGSGIKEATPGLKAATQTQIEIFQTEKYIKSLEDRLANLPEEFQNASDGAGKGANKIKEYKDALEELRKALNDTIDELEKQKEIAIEVKIDLFKGEDEGTQLLKKGLKFEADVDAIQKKYDEQLTNLQNARREALASLDQQLKEGIINRDKFNQEASKAEDLFLSSKEQQAANLQLELQNTTDKYQMAIAEITNKFDRQSEEAVRGKNLDEIEKNIENYTKTVELLVEANNKLFDSLENTVTKKQFGKITENIKLNAEQQKDLTRQIYLENINRLNIEEDAAGQKLALDGATKDEIEKNEIDYNNKRAALSRLLGIDLTKINDETNEKIVESDKQRKQRQLDLWQAIIQEVFKISQEIAQLQIQQAENAINAQQRRVDKAKEIAEQGNAEVLQLEEERLDKLVKLKQKYVAQQQALALAELVANSLIAIANAATAQPPQAVPYVIAANIAAIIAGIAAAKTQIAAAGSFETGGYTGDGGRKETAGVVHKGEFVFTQEKTKKYRTLFEEIHKGRDPFIAKGLSEKVVVINNSNMDEKLGRIEKAIRQQKGMELHISEDGIHGIVSHIEWKNKRIANKAR